MSNRAKNNRRERFLRVYANIPLNARQEIILELEKEGTITWEVAYFEVKNKTPQSAKILEGLENLSLI